MGEDVNLANIVLLRSFSINVPIQSINFIANDRVILASHVEGMTVLKANVRSGIAQRKLVIEHKKKKLVMFEGNSSIQDSSKADTKKEEIGQHGTVVATTQEESAKTEEKSESIVVETEKIPAEKSFPITGYVPYNDVVTSHQQMIRSTAMYFSSKTQILNNQQAISKLPAIRCQEQHQLCLYQTIFKWQIN